jgi:hypothetical protein
MNVENPEEPLVMEVENPEEPPEDELERLKRLLREAQAKRDRYQGIMDRAIERGNNFVRIGGELISLEAFQEDIDDLNGEIAGLRAMIPQEGGALVRNPRENPPKVRKLLEKIGNEEVQTIKLVRTPLSSITRTLLNIASFGQLDKVMRQIGVDKFFHLSMLINGKFVYEKNEVINLTEDPNIVKSNSETLDVPVDRVISINDLVKNTQLQMSDSYGPYDAKNNNCSIFISNVLKANWLSNQNAQDFLSQKTEQLFDSFPSLTKNIVDFATTAGAVVDRTIQGEGKCMCGRGMSSNFGSQTPAPAARARF